MSCVVCESDAVQLRPAVDVLVVPYSVRLNLLPEDDHMIENCRSVLSVLM